MKEDFNAMIHQQQELKKKAKSVGALKFNEDEDMSDSDSYFSENDDAETMKAKAERLIDEAIGEKGDSEDDADKQYDSEGNLIENFDGDNPKWREKNE